MEIAHDYLQLARVKLHVATAGSGFPVILLHGWPQTWHEWRKVMPLLAGHHRLIVPDLPGLGDSSRPLDGYDKKMIAADLRGKKRATNCRLCSPKRKRAARRCGTARPATAAAG